MTKSSDDLVTALRGAKSNSGPDDYLDQLLEEAADAIDRLERDKEILSSHIREMALSLGKQAERVKMLEEDIVELCQYEPPPDPSESA